MALSTLVPLVWALIAIFGITANSFVIFILVTTAALKSATNIIMLNLAVADLLFITLCMPLDSVFWIIGYWSLSEEICQSMNYFMFVIIFVSTYTIVIMATESLIAASCPAASRVAKYRYILPIIWSLAFLASVFAVINSGVLNVTGKPQCVLSGQNYTWLLISIFSFLLPVVGVFVINIIAICKLKGGTWKGNKEQNNEGRDTAFGVFIIVFAFFVHWTPYHVVQLDSTIGSRVIYLSEVQHVVFGVVTWAYSFTCSIPVLYSLFVPQFRREMSKRFFVKKLEPGSYKNVNEPDLIRMT